MLATVKNPNLSIAFRSAIFDVFALAFIFLVPAFSHMLSIPLYFIEPMRIMVVLAMVHTHRNNAFILALALPLFSFMISGHPIFAKAAIIGIELAVMVGVFYLLRRYVHVFGAIFTAIIASKLFYFGVKFFVPIKAMQSLNYASFFEYSIVIQIVVSLAISSYVWILLSRNKNN